MQVNNLTNFIKGWFVGRFEPTLLATDDFEVAVKRYKKGDYEGRHLHKVAIEITVVINGQVKMNGNVYQSDEIIVIEPGDITDFESLTDAVTVCVKAPCVKGDKYAADIDRP